jgi:hypothetical protein
MNEGGFESRCPHCGGRVCVKGIRIGLTTGFGDVGLSYQDGRFWVRTEPLRANLCTTCGTIQRFYVNDVKHNWLPEQPGSDLRDKRPHGGRPAQVSAQRGPK